MKDVTISMDHVIEMTRIDGLPIFFIGLFLFFMSFVTSDLSGEVSEEG
jgi:hypothetical protein